MRQMSVTLEVNVTYVEYHRVTVDLPNLKSDFNSMEGPARAAFFAKEKKLAKALAKDAYLNCRSEKLSSEVLDSQDFENGCVDFTDFNYL